jgi:hypothetical protein
MKTNIVAILLLVSFSAFANTDIKPQGQDRGGAPIEKLAIRSKTTKTPDKLLPFYSLPTVKGHQSLTCESTAEVQLFMKNDQIKTSIPLVFTCSKKNEAKECNLGGWEKIKHKNKSYEKFAKIMNGTLELALKGGLDYYLSENRVDALASAKKEKDGWVATQSKGSTIYVNNEMTELKSSAKDSFKSKLESIDGYLFVNNSYGETSNSSTKLTGKIDIKYALSQGTYYPSSIRTEWGLTKDDIDGKIIWDIAIKSCTSK